MVKAFIKNLLPQSFLEERAIQQWYQQKVQVIPSVETAIQNIKTRWGFKPDEFPDRPIFIFSAEWRSGSTLLQRLVNSDQRVLIWGEPFHKGNFVQCLSDSLKSFTANFPPDNYFIDSENFAGSETHLFRRWTANLYPDLTALIEAQRNFYTTLYAQPALKRGFERWGIKEVRLTIDHAHYLKWLFPQAKFLFLYRNPYKAYQSCHTWRDLYIRWPEVPVPTPDTFGTFWQSMVEGYFQGYQKVGGRLIKYEEFCQGNPSIQELSEYLELNLDPDVMLRKIGSQKKQTPLSKQQIKRLKKAVNPLADQLGYHGL